MNRSALPFGTFITLLILTWSAPGCRPQTIDVKVKPTCASVEVLHPGVVIRHNTGPEIHPDLSSRVEIDGRVLTSRDGRAVIRTDNGLELYLSGDTEVSFADGQPQIQRGQLLLSSWGDEERSLKIGSRIALSVKDSALAIEQNDNLHTRVIALRGEVGWHTDRQQGRLQQGELLEGGPTFTVHPAPVWNDWTGGAASPEGVAHRGSYGIAEAFLQPRLGEPPALLAIKEQRVRVNIEGDVAITTVSQVFFNGSEETAPVQYRIRLPEGALVSNFTVDHSGDVLTAVPASVTSRSLAAGTYALLSAPDGSLYARLQALPPGRTLRCELRYVEWLAHRDGVRTYTYPMGDPVTPPFIGEFFFELDASRARVTAIRGPVGSYVSGTRLRYARSDFRPRADLHIDLFDETPPEIPSARLWQSAPEFFSQDTTRYALLDLTLPTPSEQGTDLVVVVDTSAGTDPGVLSMAAAAVDAIAHQLGSRDRMALMFGDLRGRAAPGSAGQMAPVHPARREEIVEAIARARPGGATNLLAVLTDAYRRLDPRRNGAVIYLGDATPTTGPLDSETLTEEVIRQAPDLRLYVIAIGNEVHPEVLAPLARRGGMVLRAIDRAEAMFSARRATAHALRPVLRDITVDLGPNMVHPLPNVIPQWVSGEPLQLTGQLVGSPPHTLRVRARDGSTVRTWTIPTRVQTISDAGDIRRRWGLARFRTLEDTGASPGALADVAVRFGLITHLSALVLKRPATDTNEDSHGYQVAGSFWSESWFDCRLPRFGRHNRIEPRNVYDGCRQSEPTVVIDDESGWQRHQLGDTGGVEHILEHALALAEPQARRCVERARSVRRGLHGSVTVTATIDARGHVTSATVHDSTLRDTTAETCIRRAVLGLTVPSPSLLGLAPGTVSRAFFFPPVPDETPSSGCPPSSRLPRRARIVLWQERINNNSNPTQTWTDALNRCELRLWEDRTALLDLLVRSVDRPADLSALRNILAPDAAAYLDRAVARRFGPSKLWYGYLASRGSINWDHFLRRLRSPALTLQQKIDLVRAYHQIVPHDIDVRLRLMTLYERAGRIQEALHVAEQVLREPSADARVRTTVGELLLHTGRRDEALRVFSEIVEQTPYDPRARMRLGDLLLAHGQEHPEWIHEAYLQYKTLIELRPNDTAPQVRLALAALAAHRNDEALRILRNVTDQLANDPSTPGIEALLASEVARQATEPSDHAALQKWLRWIQPLRIVRDGALILRWDHPDVVLDLRTQQPGDTSFAHVDLAASPEEPLPLHLRVFSPGPALEGSRIVVRANRGLGLARSVTAHVGIVRFDEQGPHYLERTIALDARTPLLAFTIRGGTLVDDNNPLPATERPTLDPEVEMY